MSYLQVMNSTVLTSVVILGALTAIAQDDIPGYRSIDVNMTDGSHTYIAFQPEMTIGYNEEGLLHIRTPKSGFSFVPELVSHLNFSQERGLEYDPINTCPPDSDEAVGPVEQFNFSRGIITVSSTSGVDIMARIFSTQGTLEVECTGNPVIINTSAFAAGVYILSTDHNSFSFIK